MKPRSLLFVFLFLFFQTHAVDSASYLDIQEVSPGDHVVSAGAIVNPGDSFCLSIPLSITLPTFETSGSVRVGNNAKTKIRKRKQNLVRQARHREKITPKIQQESNPQLPHSAYHNAVDPSFFSSPGISSLQNSSGTMNLEDAIELTVRKTVPILREVSALASIFKVVRGAIFGKSDWRDYHAQPRTRFAYPTDLKYVQSRTDYEISQMYNQFFNEKNKQTSLLCGYCSANEILQRAWSNTKFCEFACDAQQLLIKRFEKEEQKRERKLRAEKTKRQAQLKKQQEAKEKKTRKRLEKIQKIFLDHESYIEAITEQMYEQEDYLLCEKRNKENIFLIRHQQRIEAFETALANGFHMQYKAYNVEQKTRQLLQKENIDVKQFESCTGNAIQQQFHAEFVDTLNNSADLKNLDLALDKDLWFSTVSNLAHVGSLCNNIGQIGATQRLSDICFGLYQLGYAANLKSNVSIHSIPNGLENIWTEVQNSLIVLRDTWKSGGDAVSDFMSGVQQKAFGRPAEYLSQFLYTLKKNPGVVLKKIGDILLDCAQCSLETAKLLPALIFDPLSTKTTKIVFEFDQNWIIPLLKKIEPAGQAFYEMSFKEKSQEVVALGMQVVSAVGVVKLSAALAAETSLGWTALGLKLNQLSQTSASTFNTTIPSGGGAAVVIPAVEVATEKLVGAAGQVVAVGTGIGAEVGLATELAANVLFAATAGGPEGQANNFTPEQIEAIENGKIRVVPKGKENSVVIKVKNGRLKSKYSFTPSHKKIEKLVERFNEKIGTPHCFEQVGIKKIKNLKKLIKHSLGMEHQYKPTRTGVKQIDKGLHHLHKLWAEESGAIKIQNKCTHPISKVIKCDIFMNGQWEKKTLFPAHWRHEQVIDKIVESLHDVQDALINNGRIILEGRANCGVKIRTVLEINGTGISVYPIWN